MPMNYAYIAISDFDIPKASSPIFQHLLETYASETNKVISVWHEFSPGGEFAPAGRGEGDGTEAQAHALAVAAPR